MTRFPAAILILLLFLCPGSMIPDISAAGKDQVNAWMGKERDSVRMAWMEKFKVCSSLLAESGPDDAGRYIDMMAEAATNAGFEDGVVAAMYNKAMLYYVTASLDDFLECASEVKAELLDAEDDRYVFVEIFVIRRLLSEGRNETAVRTAKSFLELAGDKDSRYWEAYASYGAGLAYMAAGNMGMGLEFMEKAYAVLSEYSGASPEEKARIALDIMDLLIADKKFSGALSYGDKVASLIGEMDGGEVPLMRMYLHSSMAICYISLGEMPKARESLDIAESLLDPDYEVDVQNFNKASALYYLSMGDYARALDYARQCIDVFSDRNLVTFYNDYAQKLESEILAASGDYRSAYYSLLDLQHSRDSLASERMAVQMSEFYTLYEVERLDAKRRQQRTVIFMTASLSILLLVIAVTFIVYSRQLNKKNRSLYNSIQENLRKEHAQSRIRKSMLLENVAAEEKLYYRLCKLMDEEQLFRDSNLKRTALASKLGTNEKYLAEAVKEGAGLTITGFITEYRLNYSVTQLSEKPGISLEEVAEISGFGAYSSFFRSFSKKFGMTPAEYRKYLRKN